MENNIKLSITSPVGATLNTAGKYCYSDIAVVPKLQDKTVTENGTVTPDEGYAGFSRVIVDVETSGGASLNIAYGDTAPEDTSKLWIKTEEPQVVKITPNKEFNITTIDENEGISMTAMAYPYIFTVDKKIHIVGGTNTYDLENVYQIYDTETKNLSARIDSSLNAASCARGGAAYVNGYAYFFMGADSYYSEYSQIYDPIENYVKKTFKDEYRQAFSTVSIDDNIYLIGGILNVNNTNSYVDSIKKYNATFESYYTYDVTLPNAAAYIAACVVGKKIYIFGGYSNDGSVNTRYDTINVLDTETNTMSTLSTILPYKRSHMAACAIGSKIFLFGGNGYKDSILIFDTETETIIESLIKMPVGLASPSCAVVDDNIYIIGGYAASNVFSNKIYSFKVQPSLNNGEIIILTGIYDNKFNLISSINQTLETGICSVYKGTVDGYGEKVEAYLHNGTEWVQI